MKRRVQLELELEDDDVALLEVLAKSEAVGGLNVVDVVRHLVASAVDGVRRPGAWERSWLEQAFGSDWTELLEQDDLVEWHDRPRRGGR